MTNTSIFYYEDKWILNPSPFLDKYFLFIITRKNDSKGKADLIQPMQFSNMFLFIDDLTAINYGTELVEFSQLFVIRETPLYLPL